MFRIISKPYKLPKTDQSERIDEIVKKIVASYSHGNVNLQFGRFNTEKRAQAMKEEALKIEFI